MFLVEAIGPCLNTVGSGGGGVPNKNVTHQCKTFVKQTKDSFLTTYLIQNQLLVELVLCVWF